MMNRSYVKRRICKMRNRRKKGLNNITTVQLDYSRTSSLLPKLALKFEPEQKSGRS